MKLSVFVFIGAVVVVAVVSIVASRDGLLGYEVPPSATATNFATGTAVTVSDLTLTRTQTQRFECINTANTDVYLGLGTTTNIQNSGVVLRASSSFAWTAENGLLFTGRIYTSGTVAATLNIKCTQIP